MDAKEKANEIQSRKMRSRGWAVLKYVLLAVGAIALMFPFLWMLATSLKTLAEATAIPPQWLPDQPQWENYVYSWNLVPFGLYFRNTILIGVYSVAGTLVISILGAYAFTIYSFPCKKFFFFLFMVTMMVPSEILMIQNYVTCSDLGLLNTFSGIVLPTLANGFYVFMLHEYFMQTPPSLFKAAKVDGCSDWKYLWRIVIPMNKNAIATVSILTFISAWNSFMWPLLVTSTDDVRVLSLGLLKFQSMASSNLHNQMAAACIVLLPMVVFYIVFRKKIISGVASSGIKG